MAISRSVVVALALVGCGESEPEDTSEIEAPSIVDGTPFVGPAVPDKGSFAPLAVRGRVVEGAISNTSPIAAHQARHSDGTDLSTPARDVTTTFDPWVTDLTGVANASQLQPPAIGDRLHALLADSSTHLGELDPAILELAANLLKDLPGFSHSVLDPEHEIVAWTPERARWLDSVWAHAPTSRRSDPDTHFHYPIPSALAAFPDRAARLYCAAREVTHYQTSSGSLGDQVLLPIKILGHQFDIGVFDPVAYVNRPAKQSTADVDGVNAFNIPLLLGVTIWPVRGLLPPLPQIRYPLVISSTDSEVLTDVGREWVYEDQRCFGVPLFGSICIPILKWDFRGRFKSLLHTDTMQWASQELTSGATIPLFYAGPMEVDFSINFGAAIGKESSIHPPVRDIVYDDRMMVLGITPPMWPTTIRQTGTPFPYYDGYWQGTQTVVPGDASPETFNIHSVDDGHDTVVASIGLGAAEPLRAAALADDDHHVAPVSELSLGATITGSFGAHIASARIQFQASGTLGGSLGIAHDVRDGVGAIVDPLDPTFAPLPIQSVVVTPTTYGNATFTVLAFVDIAIPLPFHTISAHFELVNKTIAIASFETPWAEDHRLRIGTASQLGDPTFKPTIESHVGATELVSFAQSVPECLADPTQSPLPPLPCTPDPVVTSPATSNTCFVTSVSPQIDPCLNIPAPSTDPLAECQRAELTYMCGPVAKQQAYKGDWVLAHKMVFEPEDSSTQPDLAAIADIAAKCTTAEGIAPAAMDDWFAARFHAVTCTDDATLIAPEDVVTSPEHAGPIDAGHCH